MANPFIPQEDIVNRINRTTGVTGGRQYSTPLPANKVPNLTPQVAQDIPQLSPKINQPSTPIQNRINSITGVAGRGKASIPLPANKIPKQPGTSLVPAGQRVSSGPDARVTKDFFRQPAQPTNSFYGADASYDGPVQQGRNLSTNLKPKIDPYTGQPVKPAFQGAKNFAKGMGNAVKGALKGAVADPTFLYGMADSANQAVLEKHIEQGDLGIGDAARLMFSGASRFPRMIAELASGQTLTPLFSGAPQASATENQDYKLGFTNPGVLTGREDIRRDNMSAKGTGFLGNVNGSPNGNDSDITEYSTGVGVPDNYQHIPGLNPAPAPLTLPGHKYIDVPSVVPGLTPSEINSVQQGEVTDDVYNKAVRHAADRQWEGKPVFARDQDIVSPLAQKQNTRQGNIVGNVSIPDSTINPAFQQRTLAPETYQNSTVDGIIPAKNQATQKPVQSSRRSLAPTGDNTGVFMGDFKIAKGQDANGKTNWEQQPQRVLTVNNEFQDMSDPVSQAALAQSDANFSRSAPRYNAGGQGGSGGVGPVTQVYRGSERTDYAFDGNGDPYVVPQKNSDTDLKMKNDQANQGLASQKAQRDYEMDQKRLGLEERRLNASLQPKPVSPEYAPVYDEIADSMGGTTKRLSGGYDKTTGQFKPVDNGGKVKDFQSLFSKYQKALEAGMPKEQADAELLRLMGN